MDSDLFENKEIEEALQKFKEESEAEQKRSTLRVKNLHASKMSALIQKRFSRFIKDEAQANMVLLGFVVVCLVLSFIILSSGSPARQSRGFISEEQMNAIMNLDQ